MATKNIRMYFILFFFKWRINFLFFVNFQLCDEVDRMHSSTVSLSQRFKDGFTSIVPKVLELVQRNAPLAKFYKEVREEMLAEDLPGIDIKRSGFVIIHFWAFFKGLIVLLIKSMGAQLIYLLKMCAWGPYNISMWNWSCSGNMTIL